MNQVCYRHPDRPTALSCTRCGRSACPECLRPASVGQHCVDCIAQAAAAQRTTTVPVAQRPTAQPVVTYTLIAINVIVFLAVLVQAGGSEEIWRSSIYQHTVLITGAGFENEYWRLLTAGFLHQSLTHVALNMISLFIIGRELERVLGWARYLAIYLVALLGGSAAVMALEHDITLTAGASGAIYGLMGALLILLLRIKAPITMVVAIIGINLLFSITAPNISLLGHLGGFVFGAAAAGAVLWLPQLVLAPEKRTQAAVSRVGWYGLVALAVVALAVGGGVGVGVSM